MRPTTLLPVIFTAFGLLAGCSFDSIADRVNPYRIDVRQGNYVDQSMVAQLKKGMTREQVRYVLGTPLIADTFHADRWDYVYLFHPGRGEPEKRRLSLFFSEGVLDSIDGDVVAADQAGGETVRAPERSRVIEVPAKEGR